MKREDYVPLAGAHVKKTASDVIVSPTKFPSGRDSPFNFEENRQLVRRPKYESVDRKVLVLHDLCHLVQGKYGDVLRQSSKVEVAFQSSIDQTERNLRSCCGREQLFKLLICVCPVLSFGILKVCDRISVSNR
ncbi:MAG: hypothetical protein Q7U63_01415 [Polaromonas sp.]|uniref:hypothetical protein n=1 Tax=Polaromonas sp. TaxID=1869339 RepID=UPI002720CE7C|nr:hypothetical protein [Polaromonas sp.]MDO9112433.1 hypothetical protein [Polaromonas sp.]MDP1773234.1 hypothetical protein [Methylobacter sp.]